MRAARYSVEHEGAVLRCDAGPTRYFIRRRGADRLGLTVLSDGDAEQPVLFVSRVEVLEQYLFGMFGDDIREDLGLSQLDLPWRRKDLAPGYELSADMVRGYRTLSRTVTPTANWSDAAVHIGLDPGIGIRTATSIAVRISTLHGRPLSGSKTRLSARVASRATT
jgi:hypothetical protein